ncbi:MAG: hypothetical protein HN348_32445 [Proteobacteria bacterium]|nr:hypothetical protein [Pseudomonadota bacterium]
MYLDRTTTMTMTNLNVTHNAATTGGGVFVYNATPAMSYGNFWNNQPSDYSGVSMPITDISKDPQFISFSTALDWSKLDVHIHRDLSDLAGAGDPTIDNPDFNRSDIGVYGGPKSDFTYYLDNDGDGLYDGWELSFVNDINLLSPSNNDDSDALDNNVEFYAGTNPLDGDTDGDVAQDDVDADPLDPNVQ